MYTKQAKEISESIFNSIYRESCKEWPDKKWCKDICIPIINKLVIKKLIDDDEEFTTEEINILFNECIQTLVISSLKKKGIIDTFEDEDGDTAVVLTSQGKKYTEEKLGRKSNNDVIYIKKKK
jgi:hypothetical protein